MVLPNICSGLGARNACVSGYWEVFTVTRPWRMYKWNVRGREGREEAVEGVDLRTS